MLYGLSVWAWNLKGYNTYSDYLANKMSDLGDYFVKISILVQEALVME